MLELENYKELDTFNATLFERELLANGRIKYDDVQALKDKVIYN